MEETTFLFLGNKRAGKSALINNFIRTELDISFSRLYEGPNEVHRTKEVLKVTLTARDPPIVLIDTPGDNLNLSRLIELTQERLSLKLVLVVNSTDLIIKPPPSYKDLPIISWIWPPDPPSLDYQKLDKLVSWINSMQQEFKTNEFTLILTHRDYFIHKFSEDLMDEILSYDDSLSKMHWFGKECDWTNSMCRSKYCGHEFTESIHNILMQK